MAKAPKKAIGTMACWSCGKEVAVKETATGTIVAPCTWCDFEPYIRKGTTAHRNFMADVKLDQAEASAPAAAASSSSSAAPAAAPAPASSSRKMPWMR